MKTSRLLLATVFWMAGASLPLERAAEETLTYSYDASLRLTAVDNGAGKRIEYAYDASGNIIGRAVRNFVDTDGDGMDDDWEMANFHTLSRDGRGDFDGDGASDLAEFLAETNPADAASVLKVTKQAPNSEIQWTSQTGKRYRVLFTDSLAAPAWRQLGDDVLASASASQIIDPNGVANPQRYYCVLVVQ